MKDVVIIVGPTAVGKTDISIKVAKELNGEIVSADSMQIYKHFNIGSAKPTIEEMDNIPHYLIDEIDPTEGFSVAQYRDKAFDYIRRIVHKDKLPIVVGGTGLYVNSLIYEMDFGNTSADKRFREKLEDDAKNKGKEYLYNKLKELDEEAANRIHPNNIKRVIRAIELASKGNSSIKDFSKDLKRNEDYNYILIGLNRDRKELYQRINLRVDLMFQAGLVDEVRNLIKLGLSEEDISMKGIGYKEILKYLKGEYDIEEAKRLVKRNTRRYAKRQITWFKRYDEIEWFNLSNKNENDKIFDNIIRFIEGKLSFI